MPLKWTNFLSVPLFNSLLFLWLCLAESSSVSRLAHTLKRSRVVPHALSVILAGVRVALIPSPLTTPPGKLLVALALEPLLLDRAAPALTARQPHARVLLALDHARPLHHHRVLVRVKRDRLLAQLELTHAANKAGRSANTTLQNNYNSFE
jgi:hypothetical protein